jgi:hypothetical protein
MTRGSTISKLALFAAAFLAATSFAHARVHHAAFHAAPPPPQLTGFTALECSIVREQPKSRDDKNPVYKINVGLTKDDSGKFDSFDVIHTLRSGKLVDRSEQYSGANIWQTKGRPEWFWKGYRGENQMVGMVYHNDRDGWMYRETISAGGRVAYEMLADCHQVEDGD